MEIRVSCEGAEGQSGGGGAMSRKSFGRKREWKATLYKTSMLVETSIFVGSPILRQSRRLSEILDYFKRL